MYAENHQGLAAAVLASLLTLTACGSDTTADGSPAATASRAVSGTPADDSLCETIGGGGASTSDFACPGGCSVGDAADAVDGDWATYATLNFIADPSGSGYFGGAQFSGTAQSGVVMPGGSIAGAVVRGVVPDDAGNLLAIATYLGGSPVDFAPVSIGLMGQGQGFHECSSCDTSGGDTFIGIPTSGDYDTIEINVMAGGAGTEPWRVYEFCTR